MIVAPFVTVVEEEDGRRGEAASVDSTSCAASVSRDPTNKSHCGAAVGGTSWSLTVGGSAS